MNTELKTSAEWQTVHNKIVVLDPDGWDRKDYDYSWYQELISEQEYLKRVSLSTVIGL